MTSNDVDMMTEAGDKWNGMIIQLGPIIKQAMALMIRSMMILVAMMMTLLTKMTMMICG